MSVNMKKIGNDANNRIYVRLDTTILEKIEKELGKKFMAQVGVLGARAGTREQTGMTNAEIGLIHEKGSKTRNIPRRSFLEMPLITKMPGMMKKVAESLLKGLTTSNILIAYKNLGDIGEGIVLRAFATSGFGAWSANTESTIKRKGSSKPLIDTAQLRGSIANRVVTR